jgi:hypothetical protein
MQTATTITAGELADALAHIPRHHPVIVRAHVTCAAEQCSNVDSCPNPSWQGDLTIEELHTAINCVELHARD